MCKILTEKNRLCSHKGGFSVKRLSLARKCERSFEGARPEGDGEEVEGTTNFPSAASEVTTIFFDMCKMRTRDSKLDSKWGTICTPVEMKAFDGKRRKVLKGRLIKEGNETVTNCHQLKTEHTEFRKRGSVFCARRCIKICKKT